MLKDSEILLVKAIHNFKGTNNDELCFQKGDVITLTQSLDGGWWEGTLNGVTGWFPSNYVKEMKTDVLASSKHSSESFKTPLSPNLNDMKMYRRIVFQDIVDTESNHLCEMQVLIVKYLNPLRESTILNEIEYAQLLNNFEDVSACNKALLNLLEDVKSKPSNVQRIGGVFMQIAPVVKKINIQYCSDHPKAATVIEKHKDALEKFMEEHGANPPGILTLTTGLSRPFRRLEKYPALLQELQRHTQENHVDRGDTQRAASVYRDIADACSSIRKQKEMELEIMTGNIRGWEGEDIHTLGQIIHMGSVVFLTEDQEKRDRYVVLFSDTLVILSISSRMSAFIYEGKLPLSGIVVRKHESSGNQHAFEITGNMIQRILVICSSQETLNEWLNVFQGNNLRSLSPSSNVSSRPSSHYSTSHVSPFSSLSPSSSTQILALPPHPHTQVSSISSEEKSNSNRIASAARQVTKKVFANRSLRPHPPIRATLASQNEVKLRRSNSCKKEREIESEGDIPMHKVLESFRTIDRTRNTMHSVTVSAPPRLNFEEDKIIFDDLDGDSTEIKERTLVDTVYMLKDQVQKLRLEMSALRKSLEEEKQARKKLELLVKQQSVYSIQNDSLMPSLEG